MMNLSRALWRSKGANGYTARLNAQTRDIEARLNKAYADAIDGLNGQIKAFAAAFRAQDAMQRARLDAGEITEAYYRQWRLNTMGRGERFDALRNEICARMLEVNQTAAAYINDAAAGAYALGHNYQAWEIHETVRRLPRGLGAGVDFTLVNEREIRELIAGGNHVNFRVLTVDPVRDYKWNAEIIQNTLTSGVLQGQSVDKIAAGFLKTMERNETAAIRNARTALTSAAGAGAQTANEEAAEMGLKVQKEWVAARDNRTRDSHAELNGVRVDVDERFPNGLMYPGDPAGAPAEVYNCRCTMITVIDGLNTARNTNNTRESYERFLRERRW